MWRINEEREEKNERRKRTNEKKWGEIDYFSSCECNEFSLKTLYSLSIFKPSRRTITPVNIWLFKNAFSYYTLILTCFMHFQSTDVCAHSLKTFLVCLLHGISVYSIKGSNHRLYRLWKSLCMKYIIASIYTKWNCNVTHDKMAAFRTVALEKVQWLTQV